MVEEVVSDFTKEDVFILHALFLSTLILYYVSLYYGVLYGLPAALFTLFALICARSYVAGTNKEKWLDSSVIAAVVGYGVATMFGLCVGVGAFLLTLVVLIAYALLSE